MRFLHIADLHIGKSVNGYSMLDDQRFALENVLNMASSNEAKAVVLSGDIYDRSTPSAEVVALLDWFLTNAVAKNLTVLAVPGNHDSAERIGYAANLLKQQGVVMAGPYKGTVDSFEMHDEHGSVRFWLFPFLKPALVRPYFPEADFSQSYTEAFRRVVDTCDIDTATRNVAIAHQFVTAGTRAPETSDSEISLGGIDCVDVSVFEAFDYVALGHVHRPQRIGRDDARYAGSLLKYSFSEIPYEKSAALVDLGEKGHVDIKLLPIEPIHDMREIRGPFEALISDDVANEGNRSDYLRIILTDESPIIDAMSRLRAVYPNIMSVEYSSTSTAHYATRTIENIELEERSPLDLFEEFYRRQNGSELTEEQLVIAREALERSTLQEMGADI